MNDLRKAAQQALDALVSQFDGRADAIDILSAALAAPMQEPLTADETMSILNETAGHHWCDEAHLQRFRVAIERAHGIE